MSTDGHRNRRPIGLPLVVLQMALSAIAFMIVLGAMALVMPLWQLSKRLISSQRTMNDNVVVPALAFEDGGDLRSDEQRLLRYFLTEEVQSSFKAQHEPPAQRIRELLGQLDQRTPAIQLFAR